MTNFDPSTQFWPQIAKILKKKKKVVLALMYSILQKNPNAVVDLSTRK